MDDVRRALNEVLSDLMDVEAKINEYEERFGVDANSKAARRELRYQAGRLRRQMKLQGVLDSIDERLLN